ncbi:interleukin-6-like [Labrus mixtus]|uniref:interleukin-6-like n=1 Tax=Labrus mixtus TaxID=508554 RepID=UPI0029C0C0FC|nr:interleukin-6-like [Labrus mixtus]
MPYTLNACLLLVALLQGVQVASVQFAPTESLAGDTSGEEGEAASESLSTSRFWGLILGATDNHSKEFEAEFQNQVKYHMLEEYNISSLPESCPSSDLRKEACLHRLVQGLFIYRVLIKHVEKEYPSNYKLSEARINCGRLITHIKVNMKHPESVTELNSSQEEQLLKDIDSPDTYKRRMTAHSILYHLRNFLLQCKRAIRKREMARGRMTNRNLLPIRFSNQV